MPPYIGVFSAFPAELAPLVAATQVDATVEVAGAQFHTGRLGGVNVVLGLLGIGMVNARTAAERMLANFDIAAIVVSGVAGSGHNIGDVVIAESWVERDQPRVWRPNPALLALVERAAAALPESFRRCTPVPPTDPEASLICMLHAPAVVFERRGQSGDDFNGLPLPCTPGTGEIFGCDLPAPLATARKRVVPDVVDMETAAVARIAAEHRVPMLGVRGVSDGAGDPLGDRGFPLQFFDYYRLAAFNAAVVTRGVVGELGALAADDAGRRRRVCRRLARQRWRPAAKLIRSAP
jgi:nucleoside phosphorylase